MPVPERGGIQKGRNGEPVRTVLQPPGRRENEQPPEARHPLTVGEEVRMGRLEGKNPINWLTTIFMVLIHIGAIAALFFFSWTNLIVAAVIYVFAINLGIGMCYHRLLTHRGYDVPKWVEYFLAACGTLALEGGPIAWVTTHRVHHRHSDQPGDPHTPTEGTWWAHVGWLLSGKGLNTETTLLTRYAPDLTKDKVHMWLSRFHWVPLTIVGIILLIVGTLMGGWRSGLGLFLWGICLRVTLGLHATWLINSATHLHGGRRFKTRDESRNSWWVALLTGGEGWHNNHHANPVSARHGIAWYEFDPNYYGIWLLEKVGLATNVKVAEFTCRDPDERGPTTRMTTRH